MSTREQFNGKPLVERGVIILRDISTQEEVDRFIKNLEINFPDCTYEQSGVQGHYVIIERSGYMEEPINAT